MKTLKSIKRFALSAMGVAMLLVLSGCVQVDKATGQPTGLIWNTIGAPMAEAIKYFATDKGLGFGVAIIIVTIIVRLIILPLGIYQSWKATLHSEKMNALKHVLEPHQTRLKEATTQEEKLEAQQALLPRLEDMKARALKKVKDQELREAMEAGLSNQLDQLFHGEPLKYPHAYLSLAQDDQVVTILDYLGEQGLLVLSEFDKLMTKIKDRNPKLFQFIIDFLDDKVTPEEVYDFLKMERSYQVNYIKNYKARA